MKRLFSLLFILVLSGCTLAEVQVNVVSERTALENQVLGSYNSLDQDVLLVASVRGVDPLGNVQEPPKRSKEQAEAIESMETIDFHADDVDAFKRLGWVGENNQGLLTPFPIVKENVPDDLKQFAARYTEPEFNSVLDDVNKARELIMKRIIEINENFSRDDLPKIRQVFAKINRDSALPGEKIQEEDGTWRTK